MIPCPHCYQPMEACLVTCWGCYRVLNGRYGYPALDPNKVAEWDRARARRMGRAA